MPYPSEELKAAWLAESTSVRVTGMLWAQDRAIHAARVKEIRQKVIDICAKAEAPSLATVAERFAAQGSGKASRLFAAAHRTACGLEVSSRDVARLVCRELGHIAESLRAGQPEPMPEPTELAGRFKSSREEVAA